MNVSDLKHSSVMSLCVCVRACVRACMCVNVGNNKKLNNLYGLHLWVSLDSFVSIKNNTLHENCVSQPKHLQQHGFKTEQEAECTVPRPS